MSLICSFSFNFIDLTPAASLLKREISEELETQIRVGELIDTIEYDYPEFHLSMDCFWAEVVSGDLVLTEHAAAKWLTKDELDSVEWLPADITLVDTIKTDILCLKDKNLNTHT